MFCDLLRKVDLRLGPNELRKLVFTLKNMVCFGRFWGRYKQGEARSEKAPTTAEEGREGWGHVEAGRGRGGGSEGR